MRIGLVADFYYPWIGGPAAAIRNLAHGLADRGHDVFLLVPSATGVSGVEHEGVLEVRRAATTRVPFGYNIRASIPPRGVSTWMAATQPDIIHVHHPFPLSAAAILAARRREIPVVATNHTIPSCSLWGMRGWGPVYSLALAGLRQWIVALLRQCDAVSTPTSTAARLLSELGFEGPIRVISNGVDTDRFSPGPVDLELRDRLGLDSRPTVLYTGRLDAEKEMGVWLRSAASVTRHLDVQLVIGGEGTDRRRLERLARELGIGGRTRFIGYVADEELPALYRLADVYLMMSPVELQSISTLEALASGLPVVAADAAALPELVRDGSNGYLVVHGDWEEAARALMRVLRDEGGRQSMSANSRRIALDHALFHSIDGYERLLTETLARARGDRRVERLSAPGW